MSNPTGRRGFLRRPLPAGQSVNPPLEPPAQETDASYLLQVARPAMGCEFQVYLNAGQHEQSTDLAVEALDLVELLENQLTVYHDRSEVARINQKAGQAPRPVEPRLFDLLSQAVELYRETDGAFDITSGPLSKLWGFWRRSGSLPPDSKVEETLQHVGSQFLQLDPDAKTIQFERQGLELNLGSIGKGYALDRCAELLDAAGVTDYLLHGGQSSILSRGSRMRGDSAQQGWCVALRHPERPDKRLGQILLQGQSLGTSGTANQFFYHQGRRYGHVLDPRNGHPATGVLSSTVVAPTAAEADAVATALFVLGKDKAIEFCRKRPALGCLLVTPGSRSGSIEIDTVGLHEGQWQPDSTAGQ